MQVVEAIEAKVKELLEQKTSQQSLMVRLAHDLEVTKTVISKIEGALEAFSATTGSLKGALGIVSAASAVATAADTLVDKMVAANSDGKSPDAVVEKIS